MSLVLVGLMIFSTLRSALQQATRNLAPARRRPSDLAAALSPQQQRGAQQQRDAESRRALFGAAADGTKAGAEAEAAVGAAADLAGGVAQGAVAGAAEGAVASRLDDDDDDDDDRPYPLGPLLAAAHLMGFYFLSSVLLVRTSLPIKYRRGINAAVGEGIDFAFYHHWFDAVFLTAAVIALANLALRRCALESCT